MMSSTFKKRTHSDRCVNLFSDVSNHIGKELRRISSSLLEQFPLLSLVYYQWYAVAEGKDLTNLKNLILMLSSF